MARKFLASRQVIYQETVVIEADNEQDAERILKEENLMLNWGDKRFLDHDYYEIVDELGEDD